MAKVEDRFERVYSQGAMNVMEIWVDRETGENYFTPDENSNRKFVIKKFPDEYYSNMINEVIE